MRGLLLGATILLTLILAPWSEAQETSAAAANAEAHENSTTTTTITSTHQLLGNEIASIKPQVGVLEFTDPTGGVDGRFAAGLGLDFNVVSALGANQYPVYYGISTGGIFSHLGASNAGFLGTSGAASGVSGANTILIPADLKLGYDVTDLLRLSVHGGANAFFRSSASSMAMGPSSAAGGSNWDVFPNVGADFELDIGKSSAFLIRPDWTLTPGSLVFMGTIGISLFMT